MATFKRNKDKIYDENGNCINDGDGEQLSLDLSQKTSSTLTGDIVPDKNTNKFDPVSNSDGEVILWNEDNFYDNFEKNTQVALNMLLSVQSNQNPSKKGGKEIAYRCDSIIFKNRQQYTNPENTIFDIIMGYISSYPENNKYKIYIKDISKLLGYASESYAYHIFKNEFNNLKSKPLLIDVPAKSKNGEPLEINWWSLFDYKSAEDCAEMGEPDEAHIILIPSPFFKALALSSSMLHGAFYSVKISSQIQGKYPKSLYYILEDRKRHTEYPGAIPGVFSLSLIELQELLHYPDSYRPADIKRRILDVTKEELRTIPECDIDFTYEMIKDGRSMKGIKFIVTDLYQKKKIEKAKKKQDTIEKDPGVTAILNGFGFSEKEIDRIYAVYTENNKTIVDLTLAVSKLSSSNIKNKAAYLCKVLENGIYEAEKTEKKNQFNNFEQRNLSNDELENMLLN